MTGVTAEDPATELTRLRRLEALQAVLPALADVLDIRLVFERIVEVARAVIPHDLCAIMVLNEERTEGRVHAIGGGVVPHGLPAVMPAPPDLVERDWDHFLDHDIADRTDLAQHPGIVAALAMGFHAMLRTSIRIDGRVVAGINLTARRPGTFTPADVPVARRIADLVALALAHERIAERLAQAARKEVEARERAAALEERVRALSDELALAGARHRPIGVSAPWRAALGAAAKVAPTETTVLVTGESGTGKEVIARAVHAGSPRAKGPFVAINCAALPEQLLESELFGHERGAFSGAAAAKPGRIEQAAGGTLFLDEVGELPMTVQAKLLRFLQEREFQRLGGTRTQKADVRLVTATNRDLPAAIARGTFREDLYYRVSVFEVRIAPLRERTDDLDPLAQAFLAEIGKSLGRPAAGLSREARDRLRAYAWPGNVRELRNVLERASILCDGGLIAGEHLGLTTRAAPTPLPSLSASPATPLPPVPTPPPAASTPPPASTPPSAPGTDSATDLRSVERAAIVRALEECRFNKSLAAKKLGLSRGQLYLRLQRYGLG